MKIISLDKKKRKKIVLVDNLQNRTTSTVVISTEINYILTSKYLVK